MVPDEAGTAAVPYLTPQKVSPPKGVSTLRLRLELQTPARKQRRPFETLYLVMDSWTGHQRRHEQQQPNKTDKTELRASSAGAVGSPPPTPLLPSASCGQISEDFIEGWLAR